MIVKKLVDLVQKDHRKTIFFLLTAMSGILYLVFFLDAASTAQDNTTGEVMVSLFLAYIFWKQFNAFMDEL